MRGISPAVVILAGFLAAVSWLMAQEGKRTPKYVGVEKCISCHRADSLGNQFRRWLGTPHSRSWVMLQMKKAREHAHGMGVEDPQKSLLCLKCHATAAEDTSLWYRSFHPEDGVQCEACHGPGSVHAELMMEQMEAGGEGVPEGAMLPKPKGEKFCLTCHQGAPHPVEKFYYKKAWKRICHPLPKDR